MAFYHHGIPSIFEMIAGLFSFTWSLVGIVLYILLIIGLWKMFEKAGEPGWTSIIPLVNIYKLYKIGWGCGWLFLLTVIPIVNLVFHIVLSIKLAKSYGMGAGFAVGLIFLPSIFYMILGFSDARYYGPAVN